MIRMNEHTIPSICTIVNGISASMSITLDMEAGMASYVGATCTGAAVGAGREAARAAAMEVAAIRNNAGSGGRKNRRFSKQSQTIHSSDFHHGHLSLCPHHLAPHNRPLVLFCRTHCRRVPTPFIAYLPLTVSLGYAVGSLALVADSFHMLKYVDVLRLPPWSSPPSSDVMSLIVALYAIKVTSYTSSYSLP
jgi:hypothetical protein